MPDQSTSARWKLMLTPARSGAENMARDSALLERARASRECVFSVYSWERPTLSLGRNQTAAGTYDRAAMAERNIDIVRRPTGGRALLHHREVTYSVTAPIDGDGSLRDSYRRINRILMEALALLGVDARESSSTAPAPRPGALPCFADPAAGELVTNGAKLVGSAQVRENGALLQHGSILIEDDQGMISDFMSVPEPRAEIPAAATLSRSLGRTPSVEEVAAALFDAVRRLEDRGASAMDERDIRAATQNHLEKYASEWWTWRR